ncbi:hypothetical protein CEW46_29155 [Bacillus cereus]|nr:hypothetical protein CEW46_29155 [Bacillus cereus]
MKVVEVGKPVQLSELHPGSLFKFGDTIGMKSEYSNYRGAVEAYIVGSGEMFWGGTSNARDQVALMVQPLKIKK